MSTAIGEERKHFDRVAEKWSPEGVVVDERLIPRTMLLLKSVVEKSYGPLAELEGRQVLDCGCGLGVLSVYLAKIGARVTAFDVSPKSVDACRRLAQFNAVEDRVYSHVADFEQLPFADNSFHFVLGTRILHHVNVDRAGRGVRRVLKPDGKAFFWENSDQNPVIRFFHRHARRFHVPKLGTKNERIISQQDIERLNEILNGRCVVHYAPFIFFLLINRHVFRSRLPNVLFRLPDAVISKVIPPLRRYSMNQSIELAN